jgi:uncharacterized protein
MAYTLEFLLALFIGILAGLINTLAGNGSAITLSFLIEIMGLPPNLANGTNRIGILMQSFAASRTFYKKGLIDLQKEKKLIALVVLGAISGTLTAIFAGNDSFLFVYKWMLVLLLITLFIQPGEWTKIQEKSTRIPPWALYFFTLLLGFYAGFIQMGMGILLLALLVLGNRYTLLRANVLKSLLVFILTLFTVVLFHYHQMIHWTLGVTLGLGQAAGAHWASKHLIHLPQANLWTYRLMILIITGALIKSFLFS